MQKLETRLYNSHVWLGGYPENPDSLPGPAAYSLSNDDSLTGNRMITQERLKELLHYNQNSGVFVWKKRTSNRIKCGDTASADDTQGYIVININKKSYKAHRLAWLYVYGSIPDGDIDHKNRIRSDNRIQNLRITDNNSKNLSVAKNNVSGITGVTWDSDRKKWYASIRVDGKTLSLGRHLFLSDAVIARSMAEYENGFLNFY